MEIFWSAFGMVLTVVLIVVGLALLTTYALVLAGRVAERSNVVLGLLVLLAGVLIDIAVIAGGVAVIQANTVLDDSTSETCAVESR